MRVPIGVSEVGGGVFSCGRGLRRGRGGEGRAVGWGPAKEAASQCARVCQNYPLANYPLVSPQTLSIGAILGVPQEGCFDLGSLSLSLHLIDPQTRYSNAPNPGRFSNKCSEFFLFVLSKVLGSIRLRVVSCLVCVCYAWDIEIFNAECSRTRRRKAKTINSAVRNSSGDS